MASACNLPSFTFTFTPPSIILSFELPDFSFDLGFSINIDCPLD